MSFSRRNHHYPPIKLWGRQLIVLTGGIGTGKSFVLHCFRKLGFHVIDTDSIVHYLLMIESNTRQKVAEYFPECIAENDVINRKLLADLVFQDPKRLQVLEEILHPKVREVRANKIRQWQHRSRRSIIVEVPLFFERSTKVDKQQYSLVVSTVCAEDIQKSRVMMRNSMTEAKFYAIVKQQTDNQRRQAEADILIETGYNRQHVLKQIRKVVDNERSGIRH